jgi:hypothetical protein
LTLPHASISTWKYMQENIWVLTEPDKIKMEFFDFKLIKLKATLACLNNYNVDAR